MSFQVNLDVSGSIVNVFTVLPPFQITQPLFQTIQRAEAETTLFPVSSRVICNDISDTLVFVYTKTYDDSSPEPSFDDAEQAILVNLSEHIANALVNSKQLNMLRECQTAGNEIWFSFYRYSKQRIYDSIHRDNTLLSMLTYVSDIPILSSELILLNSSKTTPFESGCPFLENVEEQTLSTDPITHATLRTLLQPYSSIIFLDPILYHATPFNTDTHMIFYDSINAYEEINVLYCNGRVPTNSIPVDSELRKMYVSLFGFSNVLKKSNDTKAVTFEVTIPLASIPENPDHIVTLTPFEYKQGLNLEQQLLINGYVEQNGERFFVQS